MSDQAVGGFVILSGLGLLILIITIFRANVGMTLSAVALGLTGIFSFVNAKTAFQEIVGGVFIIGAAICAGLAGISHQIAKMKSASPSKAHDTVDPAVKEAFRRQGWKEPTG